MSRKPRLDTRNGLNHVMVKGNNGCLLFRQSADYSKFMHLLYDSREKDPHILLSYCLMPNHIHMLVETSDISLSTIMHRLLLRYSLYFNKLYARSGHLFQDRFKAKPCKQENYLLQLLVYIHDNPRKAGLVDADTTYPYSSERIYQRMVPTSAPVNNMRTLTMIGPSTRAAWEAYHHHLSYTRKERDEPGDPAEIRLIKEPSFCPYEEVYFDAKPIWGHVKSIDGFDFIKNVPIEQICAMVAEIFGVDKNAVKGKGKERNIGRARSAFIFLARKAGCRPVDLERELGYNPGTIAHHLNRFEEIFDAGETKKLITDLQGLLDRKIK